MSDDGPSSDTLREPSPLLHFTSAMRWPRERQQPDMPDEEDLARDDALASGRLGEIEARIAKLAERFDQLEFVIVEQFEPGMTDGGKLPAGNLRDRLDRIEAALGPLRRDAPATWADAMAADEEVLDAAMLEARLDEIAARLADLAHIAAGPDGAAEALAARLEALEGQLHEVSEETRAQHDTLLAALSAEAAARESALQGIAAAASTQAEDIKAAVAADIEARHAALVATIGSAQDRPGTTEADVDAAARWADIKAAFAEEIEARHATLLAALDEKAEVASVSLASEAAAREESLKGMAEAAEARHAALLAALDEQAETNSNRSRRRSCRPRRGADGNGDGRGNPARGSQGCHGARDRDPARRDPCRARPRMNRRQPPGHTQEHSSFAGFATALQTTLSQFEVSVDSILDRLDGLAKRLEVAEARIAAPADPDEAVRRPSGVSKPRSACCRRASARSPPSCPGAASAPEPEANPAVLDHLGTLVTAAVDGAARDNRAAIEETLHDLRLAVAEIAADSLRLRSAWNPCGFTEP